MFLLKKLTLQNATKGKLFISALYLAIMFSLIAWGVMAQKPAFEPSAAAVDTNQP